MIIIMFVMFHYIGHFFLVICKINEYNKNKLFVSTEEKSQIDENIIKYFYNHQYKSLQEKYYKDSDIFLLKKYTYLLKCQTLHYNSIIEKFELDKTFFEKNLIGENEINIQLMITDNQNQKIF